jgi:hypothetical protein
MLWNWRNFWGSPAAALLLLVSLALLMAGGVG